MPCLPILRGGTFDSNQQQATDMRLLTTILMIWPITVFGMTTPDALPPYGLWECEFEVGVTCNWNDHSKLPECEMMPADLKRDERIFKLDLESSPMSFSSNENEDLHYIGPTGGVWTFVTAGGFFLSSEPEFVIVINPSKRTFTFTWFDSPPYRNYLVGEGTCTNITPKEPEKPTEGETKDTPVKG